MKRFSDRINIRKSIYRATHWETWHWLVKYIPMAPFWIWYCIKARSFWFFTASNPTLTFGGYDGENKMEMYDLLPANTYPKSLLVRPDFKGCELEALVLSSGLSFPVAVKPDVGRMGLMFRKIDSATSLIQYHSRIKVNYIIQEFVLFPLEVSVFYYRFPGSDRGTITGFVKKEPLSVTGDGISTLYDLMLRYPRIQFRLGEMKIKHAEALGQVLAAGEKYILSEALNLSRGGRLISLESKKDQKLVTLFDNLSHRGCFYFGRYDIKCLSIEDLKNGKNFSILEFNGSGAEPHHVYGNNNSYFKAVGILIEHWQILYKISVQNHNKGVAYWSFRRGLQQMLRARKHIKMLRRLEYTSRDLSAENTVRQHSSVVLDPYN